ncbi:hypothetical protein G7Z17_g12309 [Cylindrodendrum hubeiense]|uniref:Uncharacterized protein n=1 Tax=Cylindrodendrum hubeiense TaxID=595255 RepID=A0A9P5L9E7_9HYPO|nr:hypothetical protein G7Z17_g12309 [Cylindrodendrum hubeiense]
MADKHAATECQALLWLHGKNAQKASLWDLHNKVWRRPSQRDHGIGALRTDRHAKPRPSHQSHQSARLANLVHPLRSPKGRIAEGRCEGGMSGAGADTSSRYIQAPWTPDPVFQRAMQMLDVMLPAAIVGAEATRPRLPGDDDDFHISIPLWTHVSHCGIHMPTAPTTSTTSTKSTTATTAWPPRHETKAPALLLVKDPYHQKPDAWRPDSITS